MKGKQIVWPLWVEVLIHCGFVAAQALAPAFLMLNLVQRAMLNLFLGSLQGSIGIKVSNDTTFCTNMSIGAGAFIHTIFVAAQVIIPQLSQFQAMTVPHQAAVIAALTAIQGAFGVGVNHGGPEEQKP